MIYLKDYLVPTRYVISVAGAGHARDEGSITLQSSPQCRGRLVNLMADVGRNKPVRALSAGQVFPAIGMPETPTLAVAGRSYSGLLRDVYNNECSAWERGRA